MYNSHALLRCYRTLFRSFVVVANIVENRGMTIDEVRYSSTYVVNTRMIEFNVATRRRGKYRTYYEIRVAN